MMIILHFQLKPQFKYDLLHINFTSFNSSAEDMNSIANVWLHSSVGRALHRHFAEVTGSNPVEPDFFRLLLSNCLNWKIYCDDHSSLSVCITVLIEFSQPSSCLDEAMQTRKKCSVA